MEVIWRDKLDDETIDEMAALIMRMSIECDSCADTMRKCAECKYDLDGMAGRLRGIGGTHA